MEEIPWFECDDEELDPAQREFVHVLRDRARSWPVQPIDTVLLPPDHTPYGRLLAYLDIDDPQRNRTVLTVGAHFDGAGARGDKLHNQDFTLPSSPSALALEVTGSPHGTAIRTADWFEAILRRPLVRYEWLHAGQTYATRYLYADTGLGLSQGYVTRLAPPGLTDRLTADGFDRGGGWIDTAGLGQPDRITHVRGTDAPQ
ncbi:hypothetical protein [Streptomyces griseocarneus]|uniref:hypothetical protein n=1 Tax=Streptomyces griseocarneus TaxID=51201 RepID=UPI00167C5644|nr:hypothetical protein [Streptomyces griseocarneus]MBZ6475311.1 hypothetical protein [Streptomyces griseocarneus]GHG74542.1 hypothetical protein GCM10018779_51320 [Streptomyces griseocarneus]